MPKVERWAVKPPAPLSDKTQLLTEVRDWADMSGVKATTIWVGLEPSLLLIEKIMVEYEEIVVDTTGTDRGEPGGGATG